MALPSSILNKTAKVGLSVWKGFKTMSTDPKMPRILKVIGTHSGQFHCDEALACFMLKQLPEYADAEIKRTRDMEVLNNCDIVVDVGSVYDPDNKKFDHHQKEFNETISTVLPNIFKNKNIKLSSAGLVYAHYGLEVISEVLKQNEVEANKECLLTLFTALYDRFIEEIDAIDNGVPMYAEGQPKYRINTNLSARVGRLNPDWNSTEDKSLMERFQEAIVLVGKEFVDKLLELVNVWWPAREIVKRGIKTRLITHDSGEIIELSQFCPWKDHMLTLEEDLGLSGEIKFVIFSDAESSWRVQAVPITPDNFICRVFLHDDWRGLRDEELSKVSGIKGCVFCHSTGFIGGNKTKEGALEMAVKSLKDFHSKNK